MKSFLLFICVSVFSLYGFVHGADRKYDVILNPDCLKNDTQCTMPNSNGSFNNLIYIKAIGTNDTLHILYSSIDSLTLIIAKTKLGVDLSVNWDNLLSGNSSQMHDSIKFSSTPIQMTAFSIPEIIEFDDYDGTADLTKISNNITYWNFYKTSELIWDQFNISSSKGSNIGTLRGFSPRVNGSFNFVIRYVGSESREKELPHILMNSESTAVDFSIEGVDVKFERSKFAANIAFVADKVEFTENNKRTMDDEYTPGTFKTYNVLYTDTISKEVQSYFQFKPIMYTDNDRTLENSTITHQYPLKTEETIPQGLASVFFDENTASISAMNVSFGVDGDEKDGYYYKQTNYSVWSFAVGHGDAPTEKMSAIVTIVIFAGFGLPAVVILAGLIVMLVKKIKKNSNNSSYGQL